MRARVLSGLAGVAVLCLSLLVSMTASASVNVGEAAPGFSLNDENGKAHALASYRGKVVVLEWTNPRCPFVVRHYKAATMKKLAETYAKNDVVWLAVNSSHFALADDTKAWAKKHGHTYHTLHDPSGKTGHAYGAATTPHMFVIDGGGVVRYAGAIDDDPWGEKDARTNYVEQSLTAMVAGGAPKISSTDPYGCSVKYKK